MSAKDQSAIDAERLLPCRDNCDPLQPIEANKHAISCVYKYRPVVAAALRALRHQIDVHIAHRVEAESQLAAAKAPYLLSCPWCMADLSQEVKAYQFMHLINHGDNYQSQLAAAKASNVDNEAELSLQRMTINELRAEIAVRDNQITELLALNDNSVLELERLNQRLKELLK